MFVDTMKLILSNVCSFRDSPSSTISSSFVGSQKVDAFQYFETSYEMATRSSQSSVLCPDLELVTKVRYEETGNRHHRRFDRKFPLLSLSMLLRTRRTHEPSLLSDS